MLAAGFCQFVYNVPFERSVIYDIKVTGLTFEHGEPIVMFRREDDIFHSRILGGEHHFFGIELGRVESTCFGTVFAYGYLAAVHNPFGSSATLIEPVINSAVKTIRSPMYEHSELGFAPPSHFLVMAQLLLLRLGEYVYC